MNIRILKANTLLLIAAVIWGNAFVAQRLGMDHLGPFFFSGIRFVFGSLFLLPIVLYRLKRHRALSRQAHSSIHPAVAGFIAGIFMCLGINLQQLGLVFTTAGKAGFITGLYVLFVPLFGIWIGHRPGTGLWIAAPLGCIGMYFLSITESFTLAPGDGWVLLCAMIWAIHVLVVGWLSPQSDPFVLSFGQSFFCAVFSLIAAYFTETLSLNALIQSIYPLLYAGVLSVGIGFTLQIIGQKDSPPTHAAIILQLEALFAALSGWLILDEYLSSRAVVGALLLLAGMLIAQLWPEEKKRWPDFTCNLPKKIDIK